MEKDINGKKYLLKDDGSLAWLFFRTVMHFRKHNRAGYSQQKVLSILYERESICQKDLQEILEIQAGSMSELLSKLQDRGLVERVKNEKDRRSSVVRITEEGRRFKEKMPALKDQAMFGVLDETEKEQLRQILKKLYASSETEGVYDFLNESKEGGRK
jgi:DNA-binding MarR family transcriptional regulator